MYFGILCLNLINIYCFLLNKLSFKRKFFILQLIIIGIVSLCIFTEIILFDTICYFSLYTWCDLGLISMSINFLFDKINTILFFLVILISFCVHLFSFNYLEADPHITRFIILFVMIY